MGVHSDLHSLLYQLSQSAWYTDSNVLFMGSSHLKSVRSSRVGSVPLFIIFIWFLTPHVANCISQYMFAKGINRNKLSVSNFSLPLELERVLFINFYPVRTQEQFFKLAIVIIFPYVSTEKHTKLS